MFVLFLKEFCQYHFSKNIFCTRNKYLLFSFNAQLKLNPGIPQLPKEEICLLKCLLSVKVELEPGYWFGRLKLRFFPPKISPSFIILFIKVYLKVQSYCRSSVLLDELKRTFDRKIFLRLWIFRYTTLLSCQLAMRLYLKSTYSNIWGISVFCTILVFFNLRWKQNCANRLKFTK